MYRCCRKIVREDCNFAAKREEESHIIDCENGAICAESSMESQAKGFFEEAEGAP
jgi:hypothetical protein